MVYFSAGKFWKATEEQWEILGMCGFSVPEGQGLGPVRKLLPPPRGYTKCQSLTKMFEAWSARRCLCGRRRGGGYGSTPPRRPWLVQAAIIGTSDASKLTASCWVRAVWCGGFGGGAGARGTCPYPFWGRLKRQEKVCFPFSGHFAFALHPPWGRLKVQENHGAVGARRRCQDSRPGMCRAGAVGLGGDARTRGQECAGLVRWV